MAVLIGGMPQSDAGNDSKSNQIHSAPVNAGGELKDGLDFRGLWECFPISFVTDFERYHMVRFSSPF